MKLLFDLFFQFAKIGLFTFGGGYAMISIIEDICLDKKQWLTHEEMINMTIIAESTPGPIAVNCSTYIGYKQAGVKGALIATFGMVLPSFIIIYLISLFLDNFLQIRWVAAALKGIKTAVGILIIQAGIKMMKSMQKKPFTYTVLILSCAAMLLINIFSLHFSSVFMLLIAAFFAVVLFMIRNKYKGGQMQ